MPASWDLSGNPCKFKKFLNSFLDVMPLKEIEIYFLTTVQVVIELDLRQSLRIKAFSEMGAGLQRRKGRTNEEYHGHW